MEPTDAFDYALRGTVRNNPVVRELDPVRHRELRLSLVIGAALVVVAVVDAWERLELIRHGYEVEALQRAHADEEVTRRHLRLEVESLRAPQRIEQIAASELGMVTPTAADTIVLERVLASEPPARSVVASR